VNDRARQTAAHVRAAGALGIRKRRRRIPAQLPPSLVVRSYATELLAVYARIRAAFAPLLAELPALVASAEADRPRLDAGESRRVRQLVDAAAQSMRAAIRPEALEDIATRMGQRASDHQRRELQKQARAALGVDPFVRDPGLRATLEAFAGENVSLIRGLGEETLLEVEKAVTRALASGTTAPMLAAEIEGRFAIGERRSKAIARDQIGKLNGQLAATRQREMGITHFVWRTVKDRRVRGTPGGAYPNARPSHFAREGKTYSYAEPPMGELPGVPVNCRCFPEPVFDDILGE
jgi:SPP1 gp7 family putative phage head morphogenesis protein